MRPLLLILGIVLTFFSLPSYVGTVGEFLIYFLIYLFFTFLVGFWSSATYKKINHEQWLQQQKIIKAKRIRDHLLWVGQSEEEVIESWGEPDRIKRNSDGLTTLYYVPYGSSGTRYKANVTLKNGQVIRFSQDKKDF